MKMKPQINSVWVHNNGCEYTVLLYTNSHSENPKYPETIVYKGSNGKVWSRHLSEWHRSMTEVTSKCL